MKERVVNNAWELVSQFHSLKKLNFLPSAFGMIWLFVVLIYQIAFTLVLMFHKQDETIAYLMSIHTKPYFKWLIIGLIIVFILYNILTPIAKWGMIQMMHTYRQSSGTKFHRSWQGFFDGLRYFLPTFELQGMLAVFSPLTIITATIFLIRITEKDIHSLIWVIMWLYFIFAFFINMTFAYANFFVVLEKKKSSQAISSSVWMAVGNINITARLYFTNIILYLRIIIIWALFLLMPFVVTGILTYFTLASVQIVLLIIFLIILLVLFIFIAYLNSVLEIFILALWHEAYHACKEEEGGGK